MDEGAIGVLLVGDEPPAGGLLQETLAEVAFPRLAPVSAWQPVDADLTPHLASSDIILLSLSQPASETLDAFLNVKRRAPSVPIVVLLGREDEALGFKLVRHGAQDCLVQGEHDGRLLRRVLMHAVERARKEAAQRKRAELARALLDAPAQIVGIVDADGIVLEVSESTAGRFGASAGQLVGRSAYDLLPPEVRATRKAYADQVFETGEPARFEDQRDGIWFDNIVHPICDEQGQVLAVAFLARDITERKEMEEELRRTAMTTRGLLNAPTDAIVLLDGEGAILDANDTMARRFGRDVESVVGSSLWDLIPEELIASRKAVVDSALQSGRPVRHEDQRDGLWLDTIVYPIVYGDGRPTQVAVVSRDITQRKQMEEELRRSLEEAGRSQRLLLALGRSAQAVQRAHTPEDVYRVIGEEISALGYDAMIFALSADGSHLDVVHMTYDVQALQVGENLAGLSAKGFAFPLLPGGGFEGLLWGDEVGFSSNPAEWIAQALPPEKRHLAGQIATIMGVGQVIHAPLRIDGEVQGLLVITGTGLSEAHVPAMGAFADQTAIALANARLYQAAQRWAVELEQRVAERTRDLQESEARYHVLFDNHHDALFVCDLTGRYVEVNEAACQLLGYSREELQSLTAFDIGERWQGLSARKRAQLWMELLSVWRGGQRYYETNVVHKSGRLTPVETAIAFIDQGDREMILAAARDITERKWAEEEVRRSQAAALRGHRTLVGLSQAAQAVQRARTPQEVYGTIGSEIRQLGYNALVFDLEEDHRHLCFAHLTWHTDLVQKATKMAGLSPSELRIPLAPDGFFTPIITRGETALCERTVDLVVKGLPKLGRPLLARLISMLGMERSVYAPLVVGGKTAGVLTILGKDLTEADLPAVALFASQASIAVENALLVEELREGRERLQRLARQVVTAQEEERRRLSRALHDEAGQALTALKIGLELIVGDLSPDLADVRRRMQDAANLTGQTMDRIRLLAQTLRPPALDSVGLNYTLQGLCQDFGERTRLSIHYNCQDLPAMPEPASIALYRCLQEALTNVAKHAAAREVTVTIQSDAEAVRLSVEDDGRGFGGDAPAADGVWSTGIGILGMRERLEVLGGRLEIESRPGQGTRIVALVPLEEA